MWEVNKRLSRLKSDKQSSPLKIITPPPARPFFRLLFVLIECSTSSFLFNQSSPFVSLYTDSISRKRNKF
uniref:Uncharacterized protein n=1 Tax=Caenorhabditis tropicalis TaxID=1561998 RepID=A0A1I7U0V9_9PELO